MLTFDDHRADAHVVDNDIKLLSQHGVYYYPLGAN